MSSVARQGSFHNQVSFDRVVYRTEVRSFLQWSVVSVKWIIVDCTMKWLKQLKSIRECIAVINHTMLCAAALSVSCSTLERHFLLYAIVAAVLSPRSHHSSHVTTINDIFVTKISPSVQS